jgi:predicted nucleic acid-binding protein
MNVVDSSFWLEYFAGTDAGNIVAEIIEDTNNLIIPSITLYEVFRKLLLETTEDEALFCMAHMTNPNLWCINA